ncbi:MAG: DUF362 domain-containing protein [Desulfosoma sp.]|uniref:DUF362 domain-containing protein n=1 Tax=Desulfosoma sp. TaxID=2603217 RepID=UPI00404B610C
MESKHRVGLIKYEKPYDSVVRAVEAAGGFGSVGPHTRVFVKPNVVCWTSETPFPKWGVITTTRVVEDVVRCLKEAGVQRLLLGEGLVNLNPKDTGLAERAFRALGYETLAKRYGVHLVDVFQRPFRKVPITDGVELAFNVDALDSDLIVNLPVLKTHAQTVVSLGIKNVKGLIDLASRKRCHSLDTHWNLHRMVAALPKALPPTFTLIDGIYSNERGPVFDGTAHRMNVLVASQNVLSADLLGAALLGYSAKEVPHLAWAAHDAGRSGDLSDVLIEGASLEALRRPHAYTFDYNDQGTLPMGMAAMGIQGVRYRKYDDTLCTYCSFMNGLILTAVARAWHGTPWDDVEVLTGKAMSPTPGMKHTILLGRCMTRLHRNNGAIRHPIAVAGCPPKPAEVARAFHEAGIPVDLSFLESAALYPGRFMKKYAGRPEFDESFYQAD